MKGSNQGKGGAKGGGYIGAKGGSKGGAGVLRGSAVGKKVQIDGLVPQRKGLEGEDAARVVSALTDAYSAAQSDFILGVNAITRSIAKSAVTAVVVSRSDAASWMMAKHLVLECALHSIPCAVLSLPLRLVNGRTSAVALKARTASQSSRFATLVGSLCPAQVVNAILPSKMPEAMPKRTKTRPMTKRRAQQRPATVPKTEIPVVKKAADNTTKPGLKMARKSAASAHKRKPDETVDYGQAARDLIRRKGLVQTAKGVEKAPAVEGASLYDFLAAEEEESS